MAAKKKKSKSAVKTLSGMRLMIKEMMPFYFQEDVPPTGFVWTEGGNGYENHDQLIGANFRYLLGTTYFDLSGYTRNHLTTFPQRITVQESGSFRMHEDATSPKTGAIILDIITEETISQTEMDNLVNNTTENECAAGFSPGPLEFQQIIFGRYRMFGHDTAIWTPTQGNLTLLNETQWGSGSPTTADKLWIYRVIIPLGEYRNDDNIYVIVPAARYVMSASISEEKDLTYLMRQKRSYELAT